MLNDNYIEFKCFKFKDKLRFVGRVIAQADSYRLLPVAAARVQSQVSLYGIFFRPKCHRGRFPPNTSVSYQLSFHQILHIYYLQLVIVTA
jgi:hypothetical protein